MEPLSKAEILRQIQLMMKELFGLDADRVQPTSHLIDDLDLDSLDAIDLAVKVEETTGRALDEATFRALRTIEDVIVAIHALLGKHGVSATRSPAPVQTES